MVDRKIVLEWMYKADQDFGFSSLGLADKDNKYFDPICVLLHQAAEKYLKAYIVSNELKFEKQHDLIKLLNTCVENDASLAVLQESCEFLNPFYQEIRYADVSFVASDEKMAKQALVCAQMVQAKIREALKLDGEVNLSDL